MRKFSPKTVGRPLQGRAEPLPDIPLTHEVLGTPLRGPWGDHSEVFYVGMGCFWGVERMFWKLPGVITTAAGYMGGATPNPTYDEVCTGRTGHAEAVLIAYDRSRTDLQTLLKTFWENHDPTTPDQQGNDRGTQYRSCIYWTTPEQEAAALATAEAFQQVLTDNGYGQISTELAPAAQRGEFYYAERIHQQYLHKNPMGYCNHGPNGMTCPVGVVRQDQLPAQQDIIPPSA